MRHSLLVLVLCLLGTFASSGVMAQESKMDTFISDLMSKMTVEEKIGQLNLISNWTYVSNAELSEKDAAIQQLKAGNMGALYGFTHLDQIRQLQKIAMSTRLHIPLMFGNDVIHGFETVLPIPLAQSTSWNMSLIEQGASMAAKEATAVGINWVFSPMVDICRDARWGRIAEGGGEDPYLGGEIAKAYVRGYQGTGSSLFDNTHAMACVKHYALYGAAESGRDYNSVFLSRQEAMNGYMNPYKQAAKAGAGSFMSSFNEFEGIPATINKFLLTDVLRDKFGFNGFVVSDATAVNEVIAHGIGDQQEVAKRALQAGLDMDMGSNAFVNTLKKSLDEGKISMDDINKACRLILEAKYKLGLFNDPYKYIIKNRDKSSIYTKENLAFSRQMADECQVLLKNNGVLPLKKNSRIALIGPFANDATDMQGTWAMSSHANECVTILKGIQDALQGGSVTYAEGSWLMNDEEMEKRIRSGIYTLFNPSFKAPEIHTRSKQDMLDEAKKIAGDADVIVACVGETNSMNGEGSSRADIHIPDAQEELLKALKTIGKPMIVVLTTGRPLILNWEEENADAILNTWSLGSESGHAIADVLFGDVNPSGKLTTSFPRAVGQLPLYYNHKSTGRPWPDNAQYLKFKSCYMDVVNGPLYPFGYGLSYTKFEYGKPVISDSTMTMNGNVKVTVPVKNVGQREGKEVVQLYIHDVFSTSTRPVKELKGFQKISLKPGETRDVSFVLSADDLKYYNHELQYVCEPGDFEIMVGPNSNELQSVKLKVR